MIPELTTELYGNADCLVSVILPNYNYAGYLEQCIRSVLRQTHQNLELILIDDASGDDSLRIMRKYEGDARVKIVSNKDNRGVSACRNRGMELAHGEYICFIDADDYWYPEKIERQLLYLSSRRANLCFTGIDVLYRDGSIVSRRGPRRRVFTYRELLKSNFIAHSTLMLRRPVMGDFRYAEVTVHGLVLKKIMSLLKIGRPIHEDYAFLLRLFREQPVKPAFISGSLAVYRDHPGSYSKGYLKKIVCTFNIYRNSENFGLVKSIFCTGRNFLLAILKNNRLVLKPGKYKDLIIKNYL